MHGVSHKRDALASLGVAVVPSMIIKMSVVYKDCANFVLEILQKQIMLQRVNTDLLLDFRANFCL